MPRNPTQTPICSPEKLECIKAATDVVDKTAFDVDHDTETNCKCLPACSTYDYPFEISTGKMAKAELMHVDKKSVGEGGKSKHTPLAFDTINVILLVILVEFIRKSRTRQQFSYGLNWLAAAGLLLHDRQLGRHDMT